MVRLCVTRDPLLVAVPGGFVASAFMSCFLSSFWLAAAAGLLFSSACACDTVDSAVAGFSYINTLGENGIELGKTPTGSFGCERTLLDSEEIGGK